MTEGREVGLACFPTCPWWPVPGPDTWLYPGLRSRYTEGQCCDLLHVVPFSSQSDALEKSISNVRFILYRFDVESGVG